MKSNSSVDVEYARKKDLINFFDNQTSQRPYDDERATSVVDGSVPSFKHNTNTTLCQEENTTTLVNDQSSSEGKNTNNNLGKTQHDSVFVQKDVHTLGLRRSSRPSKLPARFNDYVLDVNNAFLYGGLVEDVYMTLCEAALAEHGFEQSKFDYSLYVKHKSDVFVALLVYVDDILITGNDKTEISNFKRFLSIKFLIKDLGVLKYFLRIEIIKNDNGLCMSQRKYCLELLHEYGLLVARSVDIPLPENTILSFDETKDEKYLFDFTSYQKLVAIQIAVNSVFHERTKHFELDVHFVREKVLAGVIKTVKVLSNPQTAYIFTKCLGVVQHCLCCRNLGMQDVFAGELVGKEKERSQCQANKSKGMSRLKEDVK
uniref:Ribonuclease H-like domain-containing protein n=1 Tax=Tanacetum cinerariifolium TaxID=118510 RepID=A0A699HN99_TANCI|nr:ribonuclease H-like domain-containing protein [Tanacetum cinerariifolium]